MGTGSMPGVEGGGQVIGMRPTHTLMFISGTRLVGGVMIRSRVIGVEGGQGEDAEGGRQATVVALSWSHTLTSSPVHSELVEASR